MPEPSWVRDFAPLTRWKRSNRCGSSASGMPVPLSVTSSRAPSGVCTQADADAALEGELQRVREQVEHDLGPQVAVDVDRLGQRRGVDAEGQAQPACRGREHAGELAGVLRQVDRLEGRLDATGLQPGEVEEGVHQLQQPLAVAQHHLDALSLLTLERSLLVVEGVLGRAEQKRERGAELVAHVREEVGLGLVELGQRLGPGLLELVGAGVGDAGGELPGDQVAEVAVALVDRSVGVEPEDLEAVRRCLGARHQRHDERVARRYVPRPGRQVVETLGEVADVHGLAGAGRGGGPRCSVVADSELGGSRGMLAVESGGTDEVRDGPVVAEEVDQRERQVLRAVGELGAGRGDRLGDGEVRRTTRAEVAQRLHPPVGDEVLGVLGDHAEHAVDGAAVVEDRAVGERVEGLLGVAAALAGRASATCPRSPHRCSSPRRCADRCRPRSPTTPRSTACPVPRGTSRPTCRGGRRRCRRTSARVPTPSTWRSGR